MYSLLVTKLEKMVDPTVWENPWGFFRDQGTLSWQLEPNRTSFSSRCRSWRALDRVSWSLRGNSLFISLGIYFYSPSGFPELKFANFVHKYRHTWGMQMRTEFRSGVQIRSTNKVSVLGSIMMCGCRYKVSLWLMMTGKDTDQLSEIKRTGWFHWDNHTQVVTSVLYQALVME